MTAADNPLAKDDLLDSDEGRELLRACQHECPDAPLHMQELGVRLALAGILPKLHKPSKPLTGSEKRKQAREAVERYIEYNQTIYPKPYTEADQPKSQLTLVEEEPAEDQKALPSTSD